MGTYITSVGLFSSKPISTHIIPQRKFIFIAYFIIWLIMEFQRNCYTIIYQLIIKMLNFYLGIIFARQAHEITCLLSNWIVEEDPSPSRELYVAVSSWFGSMLMILATLAMDSKARLPIVKSEGNWNILLFPLFTVTGHDDTCIADGEFGPVVLC